MSSDRASTRGLPRKAPPPNLSTPADTRLSVIAEDGDVPLPPRAVTRTHHRPFGRRWNLGNPPMHNYEKSPPEYSLRDDSPPKHRRCMALRNNKQLAKRGGWKRLLCIILFLIALVVALAVGLLVGLRQRNRTSPTKPSSPSQSPPSTPTFPTGTYALNTFLDTVSTSCTSNAVTWLCYPYKTYADSPSGALATFDWVISGSEDHYLISSTNNPFAVNFVNATLNLVDASQPTERYVFTIPIDKVVVPSASITTDNVMASCEFNNTQFQASLYTRMANSYPSNSSNSSSSTRADPSSGIQPWPFAVKVIQSIGGGANVPACYEVHNGDLGARVTTGLVPQPSNQNCDCTYKNYDP